MSPRSLDAAPETRPGLVALVADGGAEANRLVRRVLGSIGVERILEAQDGAEILGVFEDRRPDLVVMSWRQAIIPAADVLACLRDPSSSHAPHLPVVVTMASPTRDEVEAALALKVDAIVAKPCSAAGLRLRLEAAVSRASDGG